MRVACWINKATHTHSEYVIPIALLLQQWLLERPSLLLLYVCCLSCLTFGHRSFTFNSNKSPTWCNGFSVYYPDVCLQLNMFRAFSRPSSGAHWLQWQPLVLPSYRGRPARPRTQHDCHHDTKVSWWHCHCSHWAPDDGRENGRNMLSCKQTSG